MSYIIKARKIWTPFTTAWVAMIMSGDVDGDYTNYDDVFFKKFGVKIHRQNMGDYPDVLELEFKDKSDYVLFMMEWV